MDTRENEYIQILSCCYTHYEISLFRFKVDQCVVRQNSFFALFSKEIHSKRATPQY